MPGEAGEQAGKTRQGVDEAGQRTGEAGQCQERQGSWSSSQKNSFHFVFYTVKVSVGKVVAYSSFSLIFPTN